MKLSKLTSIFLSLQISVTLVSCIEGPRELTPQEKVLEATKNIGECERRLADEKAKIEGYQAVYDSLMIFFGENDGYYFREQSLQLLDKVAEDIEVAKLERNDLHAQVVEYHFNLNHYGGGTRQEVELIDDVESAIHEVEGMIQEVEEMQNDSTPKP